MKKQHKFRLFFVFCLLVCSSWHLMAKTNQPNTDVDVFAQFNKGLEYLRNNKPDEAEKSFAAATSEKSELMVCLTGQAYLKYGDHAKATYWLEKSALQGFPPAELLLGTMAVEDKGIASSPAIAEAYFSRAFKDDFLTSPEIISCLEKLADNGSNFAQFMLGQAFFFGAGVTQNYEKAWQFFEKADQNENAEATYFMGLMSFLGIHIKSDIKAAIELLQRASAKEPRASKLLCQIYLRGAGVKANLAAAKKYGDGKSEFLAAEQFAIGDAYYFGRETAIDYAETAKWYRMAAENQSSRAARELSRAYMAGRGVEKDMDETRSWQEQSKHLQEKAIAEKHRISPDQRLPAGLSAAMEALTCIVDNGFSEGQIASQSFNLSEADVASRNESVLAGQLATSEIRHLKENPSGKPEAAIEKLQKAAAMGSTAAQEFLVSFYSEGQFVQQDWLKAWELLQKAAQGGNIKAWQGLVGTKINEKLHYLAAESGNSSSQFIVSQSLFNGVWGKKDMAEAKRWLKMSAASNNTDACFALGRSCILADGADGIDKDIEAGNQLLEKVVAAVPAMKSNVASVYYAAGQFEKAHDLFVSALTDNPGSAGFAAGELTKMYYSGTGVEKNLAKASEYIGQMDFAYINAMPDMESILRDLAQQNFAPAQYRLAEFVKGRNSYKDNAESIELLTRAAYADHIVSQSLLASIYLDGRDVEPDNIKAYAWASRAVSNGCEESKYIVDSIGPQLSKEQLAEAQKIIQHK